MLCNANIRFSDTTRLAFSFDDSEVEDELEIGAVLVDVEGEPTVFKLVIVADD